MPRPRPLELGPIEAHVRESPVRYSNLERVVYPPTGGEPALLKAHVLAYYLQVADWILPHVAGRPLAFRRFPRGVAAASFFTKDWSGAELPGPVRAVPVWSESRSEPMTYAVEENALALGWLAQVGAVEVHPWLSRLGVEPSRCASPEGVASAACGLDRPDVLLFDLDPYAGGGGERERAGREPGLDPEGWARAVEAALVMRDTLDALGARPFVKTSGKRGLHVIVPIEPEENFATVRAFARTLAEHAARARPDLLTLSYDAAEREGRVFVDVNQIVRGKTTVAPYSLRPTPVATVSMPIHWSDLERTDPAAFRLTTVPGVLAERPDPWVGFEDARRPLRELVRR